ncbi:DoxX family protein [Pedobacter sp. JCM 36344]|uniref:DoxX family protein n=1 Tax=Pedobacter sp. JCM 36344 TaxID=3374280 RepID=UPI0039799C31
MLVNILIVVSGVAFLFYGSSFFLNSGMKEEFERYGLDKFRGLVGVLQLLGGLGLLLGLVWNPILVIASGGLALLMLIGFVIRVKMKDSFLQSMPSFIFMLVNGYICFCTLFSNEQIPSIFTTFRTRTEETVAIRSIFTNPAIIISAQIISSDLTYAPGLKGTIVGSD